jgi:3-isopropylmalate dehydrogenase
MPQRIAAIGGDGIGPEVIAAALEVLSALQRDRGIEIEVWQLDLGAERYLREGVTLPRELRDEIRATCGAVLLGAVGDPRVPGGEHAHDILMGMRRSFDLYVNLRPVRALSEELVRLNHRTARDLDFVIFRENTEGEYAAGGETQGAGTPDEVSHGAERHSLRGVERLLRAAFEYARKTTRPLVMTDKSNAIAAQRIWARVLTKLGAEYPGVTARHVYADALAAQLVESPEHFSVISGSNLLGDVISDLCAGLCGGLGLAPSANLHPAVAGHIGLFEPIHGSAPALGGKGIANPLAAIRSLGLLLAHLGHAAAAASIERAAQEVVRLRRTTPDVGGDLGTRAATAAFVEVLRHC